MVRQSLNDIDLIASGLNTKEKRSAGVKDLYDMVADITIINNQARWVGDSKLKRWNNYRLFKKYRTNYLKGCDDLYKAVMIETIYEANNHAYEKLIERFKGR